MKLCWIDSQGVSERDLSELPALRKRTDGFLWLDIPEWSEEAEAVFGNEFHFHAVRHELLTIKTMAGQGSEIYRRAIKLTRFAPPEGLELMKEVLDQYETVTHLADSQLRFLVGVTEFYRARTDTKMTIAAERLAVIAALTLPITSLSSVMGMNVIVNESTRWIPLIIVLLIMVAISLALLRWARQ
jgi:magnesium transporter